MGRDFERPARYQVTRNQSSAEPGNWRTPAPSRTVKNLAVMVGGQPRQTRIFKYLKRRYERRRGINAAHCNVDHFCVLSINACDVSTTGRAEITRAIGGRPQGCGQRLQVSKFICRYDYPRHVGCSVNTATHRAMTINRLIRTIVNCVSDFLTETPAFKHGITPYIYPIGYITHEILPARPDHR